MTLTFNNFVMCISDYPVCPLLERQTSWKYPVRFDLIQLYNCIFNLFVTFFLFNY